MAVIEEETTNQLVWDVINAVLRLIGVVVGTVFMIKGLYTSEHEEATRYLITGAIVVWSVEGGRRGRS